jgi:hypothetical protein
MGEIYLTDPTHPSKHLTFHQKYPSSRMKTTSIFAALSAISSLSSAQFFGIIAARSASPIHLSPVNANGGGLWIGKPQSDYCPIIQGLPCANTTGFTTTYGIGSPAGALALAVGVPGGQEMYAFLVFLNTMFDWRLTGRYSFIDPICGKIGYTLPHSTSSLLGAITEGW